MELFLDLFSDKQFDVAITPDFYRGRRVVLFKEVVDVTVWTTCNDDSHLPKGGLLKPFKIVQQFRSSFYVAFVEPINHYFSFLGRSNNCLHEGVGFAIDYAVSTFRFVCLVQISW